MGSLIRAFVVNRRWWLLLCVAYAALTAGFLNQSLTQIRQHNLNVASEGARNVFRMLVVTRKWNAMHGGVYVPVTETTQPNPHLNHPRREVRTTDGQLLTMINPAFMTRMISDLTQLSQGLTFRSTSLNPINPNNAPDPWEREALQSLGGGRNEVMALSQSVDGEPIFRYLAPLWVTKECLDCHRDQHYKLGDLRGGVSITQDYRPFLAAAAPSERTSIAAHLGVFVLLVAISGWLLTALRQSWLRLEDNIAELQQAKSELLHSEKMASLGRMVAGFAHELNTPVGISVGAISHNEDTLQQIDRLLEQEEVSEAALRSELASLRSGSALAMANLRRANALVQRFKRSSVDQMSEESRVFAVRELIDDIRFSLQAQLKKGPVAVHVDCDPALRIHGVPGLIEQLLTNLLLNSLQHGFQDGTQAGNVHIAVSLPAPALLRIVYHDDGAGMAQDVAERIFEPFFTTRRGQGGTGLGMFLCYNIVTEELSGQIRCTGSPGKGVEFDITLPCTIVEEASA